MPNKFVLLSFTVVLIVLGVAYFNYISNFKENKIPMRSDINVVLYVKKTCSYCNYAKSLLERKGIPYEVIELTNNEDLIIKLVNQTGQTTVPYVFVNNEFVGGYTELAILDERGEL